MQKRELIYEGKGKKMYATDDPNLLVAEFKDDLTAFDAQKRGNEAGKGALNNKISTQLFKLLESKGIVTDLVEPSATPSKWSKNARSYLLKLL